MGIELGVRLRIINLSADATWKVALNPYAAVLSRVAGSKNFYMGKRLAKYLREEIIP